MHQCPACDLHWTDPADFLAHLCYAHKNLMRLTVNQSLFFGENASKHAFILQQIQNDHPVTCVCQFSGTARMMMEHLRESDMARHFSQHIMAPLSDFDRWGLGGWDCV